MMTLCGPRVELVGSSQYEFFLFIDSPTLRGPGQPDGPLRPGWKLAYQLCDYGARYRFRTGALYCSHWSLLAGVD